MKCYFCQSECLFKSKHIYWCSQCPRDGVASILFVEGIGPSEPEMIYAHIYTGDSDDLQYHIRLNFINDLEITKGTTTISHPYTCEPLARLEGYPITPSNVLRKLKTILTFL